METCKVTIQLKEGLQAKAAVHFVQRASAFESSIKLCFNEKKIEAKSIMGVMATALNHGTEIVITADGRDEKKALEALKKVLESADICSNA